jgi:diguanylate cyclase (GGDEF)-like protein
MFREPDSVGGDEDRALSRRLRRAMISTILLAALVLAAGCGALAVLTAAHERAVAAEAALARAEVVARELALAAADLGDAAALAERRRLAGAVGALGDALAAAHAASGARAPGRDPSRGAAAHPPAPAMARALRLAETIRDAPDEAGAVAPGLVGLVEDRLAPRLAAAAERHSARARAVRARILVAGAGLAGLGTLLLLALWRAAVHPLMRAVAARAEKLAEAREHIERSLRFDGLTGLANRRTLLEALDRLDPRTPLGLLHVDLADFQAVSATLGRETAERLLRSRAEALSEIALAREMLARVDTEDFVLATPMRTDPDQLQELAVEIIERLGAPVELDGRPVRMETVIGIAARTSRLESPEKLLANAGIARARAREEGGSVYFSAEMRSRLAARRETAQELLQALVRDEIEPYFQPQIDAASGRLTGMEALVRWRHPERGVLNPHFFLDIADEAHVGGRITSIMLKKSVAALAGWRARGFAVPRIGLNLTARELRDPRLPDLLAFDLDRAGLSPADMAIEVLESALIEGQEDPVLGTVAGLAARGFHIDLDDFGTGHAALSYLQHLAVSRLKIDRTFVRELHLRPELRKMTQAMIHLARSLGIAALAEGIETEGEWQILVAMGCDDLQGYAIGKPMPADEVIPWMQEHERRLSAGRIIAAA